MHRVRAGSAGPGGRARSFSVHRGPDAAPPSDADAGPTKAATSPHAPPEAAAAAQAWVTGADLSSGHSPLPNNGPMPLKWLPPGAFEQDRGPSAAVFPPQKLTLRFNHKFHVEQQKMQCKTCHAGATTSESVADRLTPKGTACDACHGTRTMT